VPDPSPNGTTSPPAPERGAEWLAAAEALDPAVDALDRPAAAASAGAAGRFLRGEWLGHALHPLLTDIPVGCWTAAGILDLTSPRSRRAAQRLIGLGLLAVPVTAASGLADYATIEDQPTRRVGAAHALGNGVAALLYLCSWRARRRDHQIRGVLWGLAGASVATATGYLGGHLAFANDIGSGERS
jgi:uncharacterized membrane protein